MSAALGALALLVAALLPERLNRVVLGRRGLAALGVLALLPAAEASGTWPLVVLAAAAAALATPLPLVLGAAGALLVALHPGGAAPLSLTVAALATAVAAEGLEAARRERRVSGGDSAGPILVAGLLLTLVLARVDGGAVLSWAFGVGQGSERVLLGGVGMTLGAALLAAIAGILLLGGATVAPPAPGPRRAGLGALSAAAALAASGLALALARVSGLPESLREAGALPLALLLASTGVLAVLLLDVAGSRPGEPETQARGGAAGAFRVAAALALAAAAAAGVEGWWRAGTYATGYAAASAAAALLGLAALEPLPRLAILPRLLFVGALLFLLLA